MNQRINLLLDALKMLSAAPENQMAYLRQLGPSTDADELALEFDAIAAAVDDMLDLKEISEIQANAVRRVDRMLSGISGPSNETLWTAEALTNSPEWMEIRRVAKACLLLFDDKNRNGVRD